MQIKYYQTAWNDLKNSPGWFGKLCLLALVNFIPIFGQIVTYGYLYGWAREMAWGTHRPLPRSIFANDDGKFWRRGWFLFVIAFVFGLIPAIVMGIGNAVQSAGMEAMLSSYSGRGPMPPVASASTMASSVGGTVITLCGTVLSLFISMFSWIAFMRTSIYDRLSAGFQLGKVWKMFRHDTSGAFRIFGMSLLISIILGMIAGFLIGLFAASGILMGAGLSGGSRQASAVMASVVGISLLLLLVVFYFTLVGVVFIQALVARAMGYWTMQFEVPKWRGQDDPLPFELGASSDQPVYQQAQPPAAQPPVAQPPAAQPPVAQPPEAQPPVGQPPMEQPAVAQPPIEQPPVAQPPVEQAPLAQPYTEQPPVAQPPVEQPPVEQAPATQPPEATVPESQSLAPDAPEDANRNSEA